MARRTTREEFISKAQKKYGYKYDYSLVTYLNCYTPVIIICPTHGRFTQQPNDHLQGRQCRKCSTEKYRLSTENFIRKAQLKHGQKYQYDKVECFDCKTLVTITCPAHGDFVLKADYHLQGRGCSICPREARDQVWIAQAQTVHPNKYQYLGVVIEKNKAKFKIKCPRHGKFTQRVDAHLAGRQCRACSGCIPLTTKEFIKRSRRKHHDKYDYSQTVCQPGAKVTVICPVNNHGPWQITTNHHLKGRGCPKCSHKISKPEIAWLDSLQVPHRNVVVEVRGKKYSVDGLSADGQTIYEFYGDYYHGNPKIFPPNQLHQKKKITYGELYRKTIQREKILKRAGFTVITMWELEWNNQSK